MAPGAIPRPGRVPEQRLLSPKTCLRWRRRCRNLLGKRLRWLGLFCRVHYMGERATSVGARGAHTTWPRGQRGSRVTTWCGCLLGPLRLSFGLRIVSEKIGTLPFVSSNSENISRTTFLKPRTAENRELALWHLVNRLVPENA